MHSRRATEQSCRHAVRLECGIDDDRKHALDLVSDSNVQIQISLQHQREGRTDGRDHCNVTAQAHNRWRDALDHDPA
ncbi:hypothetical protein D3C76_1256750 [compost metagenome]